MIRNTHYSLHASSCEINNSPSKTSQGEAQSVYELFQKMVLGQYLPSSSSDDDYDFDSREGYADLDSVDDRLNRPGFALEEVSQMHSHYSEVARKEIESLETPPEPQKQPSEPQTPPEPTPV